MVGLVFRRPAQKPFWMQGVRREQHLVPCTQQHPFRRAVLNTVRSQQA